MLDHGTGRGVLRLASELRLSFHNPPLDPGLGRGIRVEPVPHAFKIG